MSKRRAMKGRWWLIPVGVGALAFVGWGLSRVLASGAKEAGKGAASSIVDAAGQALSGAVSAAWDAAKAVVLAPKTVVDAAGKAVEDTSIGRDVADAASWEGLGEELTAAADTFAENATAPLDAAKDLWSYWTNGDGIGGN